MTVKPKVLFVVAQKDFRDEELLIPQAILTRRGYKTVVAALQDELAIGKGGAEVIPDQSLATVRVDDCAAVIFVGGPGARTLVHEPIVLQLARDFKKAKKITAAICMATSVLANAGVLIGRVVTGFHTEQQNIVDKGGEYTGMPVEVDGRVITAKDPAAAQVFGEAIVTSLIHDV